MVLVCWYLSSSLASTLRTRKANSSIGCLDRTPRCAMMLRTNNLAPMAPQLIKRRPLAHFMSRKSQTLRVLPGLATFQRDNSILNLSKPPAAHREFLHSKLLEILLMRLARRAVPAMPLNLIRRSPAVLTRRTGHSLIKVKVKSRLTGRMRRSRSSRCASC